MYIRHTTEYPYNNIYLFRSIESTQGIEYTDTVNVALADPLGVWNGSGMSNLKTLEIPIGKGAVRFLDDERYTLRITQGMRDTLLLGIQDVGIQFEQVKSGK
jgi:gliding motility-associated lipoprotein GldH